MSKRRVSPWEVVYESWDPREQPLREALTTLGNGYFATRGAGEETRAGGPHYPGTYLAGGYSRLESEIAGKIIENEDLVNWPNWLPISFRIEEGDWFDLDHVQILEYEHRLDVRHGVLSRWVRFRDRSDRESILESRRLVHMGHNHVAAIEWQLTPIDWSGTVVIRSEIDGAVANTGVERYRALAGRHLEILETGPRTEDVIYVLARTRQSRLVMAQAARTHVFVGDLPAAAERHTEAEPERVAQLIELHCEAKRPVRVEKIVAVYTSRDFAISEPCLEACKTARRLPCFADLLKSHELAWRQVWHRADLLLDHADTYPQLVLRLHVFHMLQTASMHVIDGDVGIPARGLHGEAYRGHIFWDELFIFPFLNLRIPELTRSLLMYRFRRLDEARHNARAAGYTGAMFPWQSGSNGREESQVLHLNPKSGRWIPDDTYRQRHVNAAIAYNVWQYYQASGDIEFLSFYGTELLLEIARFWANITIYDPQRERYEIHGVVGPDEFHTGYPGGEEPGLKNNAYTNIMAAWVLQTARAALEIIADDRRSELLEALGITEEEVAHWEQIAGRMYVPFHGDRIISQFEGWDELEELDWDGLRARHGDIQRLDRILEAEDDDPNRYKATKQADVLMLFFLFSADELRQLFSDLGYPFDYDLIPRNIQYYIERTSHGSTLSRVVHAWVLARSDRRRSWHLFLDALASDIDDIQGGTTSEGIHMGAMAGTVDLMQRCYTGIETREGVLWLNPLLPEGLERLTMSIRYRGHWLCIEIEESRMTVTFEKGWSAPARVGFGGEIHEICQGTKHTFALQREDDQ